MACLLCIRSGAQPLNPVDPVSHGLGSVVQIVFLGGDLATKQITAQTQVVVYGRNAQVSTRVIGGVSRVRGSGKVCWP